MNIHKNARLTPHRREEVVRHLVARRHDALDLGRACGRPDHAGELGEDAIARGVDDAAPCRPTTGRITAWWSLRSRPVAASSWPMSRL